jgi:hypothetical protein
MRTSAKIASIKAVLGPYFKAKGSISTEAAYKVAADAPIKASVVKRYLGTWNWVIKRIGLLSQY